MQSIKKVKNHGAVWFFSEAELQKKRKMFGSFRIIPYFCTRKCKDRGVAQLV